MVTKMTKLMDRLLLLLVLCTFMLYSSVDTTCPAGSDNRALGCRHTFVNLPSGNVTRNLNIYAGKLKIRQCIAHCGRLPKAYAGRDLNGNCFCGNALGTNCTSQECLRLYNTAGIPSSPSAVFPTKTELYATSSVTVNGNLVNVSTFAVVEDYKVTYFTPKAGSIAFVQTGSRKVAIEIEGYWNCRSSENTVSVYSKLVGSYTAPSGVRANEEFQTWVKIDEGSGIQKIQFKKDNADFGPAITSIGEPTLVATGANMAADRYADYQLSYTKTASECKTYININFEVHEVCNLKAFEAYATAVGLVRFQVFKPTCNKLDSQNIYCHSLKQCVSSGCGTPVEGVMEYYPTSTSKQVFCPDIQVFKADDNSSCPGVPTFTTAGADYMLLFEFEANLTHIGNNIMKVPDDKKFKMEPGYVIGWTCGSTGISGDIAYEAYDTTVNNMYPEYEFSETYETRTGSIFSRLSPNLQMFTKYHLFKAHSIAPTWYMKKVTLQHLGQTSKLGVEVTAADSSPITQSKDVIVQADITSLTMSVASNNAFTNTDVTFTLTPNTESASFSCHFGETNFNGTYDITTTDKTYTKQFKHHGSYVVQCRAFNFLGGAVKNLTMNIFDRISEIKFLKEIDPQPTGNTSTSLFYIKSGGVGHVVYNFGDSTPAAMLNVTFNDHFIAQLEYVYAKQGDYLLAVEAKTPLEAKTIRQYASVEDVIENVVIQPPGVAATNVSHYFNISGHIGTNVTYIWNWTDGTTHSWSTVNQRDMWHNYTTSGNRTIRVHSFNKISTLNASVFVEVQDIIKGLNYTQPEDSKFPIKPTNESTKTYVWFCVEQGTGMDISFDWDSDNPNTRVSKTAYDMDNYGNKFCGVGSHQYSEIGYYNVTLLVKNEISNMSFQQLARYEKPVAPFTAVMRQLDDPNSYIEVNETICFDMKPASGTSMLVKYDFNDTYSPPIITPNQTVCRSWRYWQLPFSCVFEVYNNVSSITKRIDVNVQRPVHVFKNLTINGGPENSTEPMELVVKMLGGDFFNCTLTIGYTTVAKKTFLYDDYLQGKQVKFQFETPGTYGVGMFCRNRLYNASAETTVNSFKPASTFEVKVKYGGKCGAKKKAGDLGDGPEENMYAYGCPLKFTMEKQTGSNITYDVDFGEKTSTSTSRRRRRRAITQLNEIIHTYANSKENSKIVTFRAFNPVSQVVVKFKLTFMPRISGMKVESDGPVKTGKPLNLNLTVAEIGLNSCFLVIMEVGKDAKTGTMVESKFWMGSDQCKTTDKKYKEIPAKPDLNPASAKWSRIYNQVGEFTVTVVGENSVSKETATTKVTVLDKPCNKPTLTWVNLKDQRSTPTNITKSKSYRCQVKVKKDCEKTDEVYYYWNITTCDTNQIAKNVTSTKSDSALKIPKRTLEYGCYKIVLKVCMADVEPAVCNSITGYLFVNPSPLVAAFPGGTGRAGGHKRLLEIKATASHDPDVGDTPDGLSFIWNCKHQNEKFPADAQNLTGNVYPPQPLLAAQNKSVNFTESNFKGCFGLGVGQLVDCRNKPTCTLNSTFMVLSQYYTIDVIVCKPTPGVFRECVSKAYTLYIVPGDPPQISISPLLMVAKVDASKDFKSLARCTSGCQDIIYEWSMEKKPVGEADDQLEKVKTFADEYLATAVNNKNLVVKAGKFSEKYEYVLRLSGYPEGYEDLTGFSMYSVFINIPPKAPTKENIMIRPVIGEPLKKIFLLFVSGFTDDDKPLNYIGEFRVKDTDSWQIFYNGINTVSPLTMFPQGDPANDNKVKIRVYCQDAFGSISSYVYKEIKVKYPSTGKVDLGSVLSANKGSTDPAETSNVVNAVMSSEPDPSVVSAAADMLAKAEVNSPEGAAALAASVSKVSSSGAMDGNAKEKALAAVGKVADFISEDTAPDVVASVTTNVFSVTLSATNDLSGPNAEKSLEDSERVQKKLGMTLGQSIVPGEAAFKVETAGSLLSVSSMEPGGSGAVSLGSGGIEMDTSIGGSGGTPFQALGGKGENKYDKASGKKSEVTSELLSLSLASGGKPVKVRNASKPIRITIPAPKNPYKLKTHSSYVDRVTAMHLIVIDNNASSLFIDIKNKTMMDLKMFVMIRKFKTPKMSDHHWNFSLPKEVDETNPDGTNKTTKQLQLEMKNRMRIFLSAKTDLNSTAAGKYYVAILNTVNTTTNITMNSSIPVVNYTMNSYSRSCQFRNETTKQWSEEGLTLSQETDENYTQCDTTHLSSFAGGGVFAKPNTIDFSKAFAGFSNIGDNPAVFSTVLSFIGLYFILLAYCRYKDKKDIEKIGVFPLEDNHPSDNYLYEVAVQTGFVKGSGSTADVFIILMGSLGETSPRKLKNPNRKCFNKGDTDAFLLTTPFSLGVIKEIEIWHNNGGTSPGWYCMQVQIRDVQSDKRWSFVCNRWLAVEEDDGLIKRTIEIARKDDLTQFDFLFAQTARKNLYDGHIWFSIFTRPPRSTFTRCQRLGCCLTLLFTSMLANAMFYKDPAGGAEGTKTAPADSIHLGPITISVDQIRIGITSSLVVVPINIIIATLFQKAKPREEKPKKKNKYEADDEDEDDSNDNESVGGTKSPQPLVSHSKISILEKGEMDDERTEEDISVEKSKKRANFLKMICMPGNDDDAEDAASSGAGKKKKPKKKAMLPHWVIYIAYLLIFVGAGTSAFFVILYGFSFGKEKSEGWLQSMMISFWQSVFVIQPIKVVAISVLVAMIIKDPKAASGDEESSSRPVSKDEVAQEGKKKKKKVGENGEEIEDGSDEEDEEDGMKDDRPDINFKLPDEKKLAEAREMRLKEKRMKAIIREIVVHLLFVLLCLFIGYSNMDPFACGYGSSVKSFTSPDLQKVSKVEEYWSWLEDKFIPYLYPGQWYNGNPNYTLGMVADSEPSKIISMARLRLLRIKKETCKKHPMFENLISECHDVYSWSNEDTEQYSAGWRPPLNKSETRKLRARKRKPYYMGLEDPWKYQSVLKLKNFPFMGKFATYSGSSYSVSVGPDERIARLIVKGIKDSFWIDEYTRAIFVELNIYNANTNLMMIVTYVSEILPTGGWNYFDNVQAIRLYRWQGGLGTVIMVADLTLLIVTIVGLYKLVKKCKKEGWRVYFKNPWHILDFLVTLFSIATFACVAARLGAVMWAMSQYKDNPEVFVSFAYVGQLDYFVSAFIGFVVFAANLEFLRLLRFNKKIGLLTTTMKQSAKPLMSFGFIFFFLFLSYVSLAHFLFVDQLEDYRKLSTSIVALVKMFLGKFDVGAYFQVAPILGPFLFFSYMIVIQMILINMFIGIICETFEEVRTDLDQQSNDHEIMSFMTHRFKKMAGAAVGPGIDPIYREWKSEWEQTLESIEEKSENIVYMLRNVEAEEVRQTRWLEPMKANEKKRNFLKMLVGSDEFTYENEILDSLQVIDKHMKKTDVDKSKSMVYKMAKKKKREKEEENQMGGEESPNVISEEEESEDEGADNNDENEE